VTTHHFPSLDQLDVQMLGELESDARQTYTDIAVKLGVSRPTIAERVRRLRDGHVISIMCWADPTALGFEFIATLAIRVQSGHITDVAHRLAACTSVRHVHLCTGRFNIVAWSWLRKSEELEDLLLNELDSIPGVLHIETMLTLRLVKVSPRLLAEAKVPQRPENQAKDQVNLDYLDLNLIKELQTNPRQKSHYLARKFGVYKTTITRRIQRLLDENVIRFSTSIHPFALGYEGVATIGLKCDPGKVREVADAVAAYKQVQYTGICAGRYDITAWVAFRKLSDLQHFIDVELGGIPGLRETDAMIIYKLVKAEHQLPL
jgi:DNA-binding Lrp family transcriptional regulator